MVFMKIKAPKRALSRMVKPTMSKGAKRVARRPALKGAIKVIKRKK